MNMENVVSLDAQANLCINTCLNVQPDERVLVISDEEHLPLSAAFLAAAQAGGASGEIHTVARRLYDKEPSLPVAQAMRQADIVIVNLEPEHGCQLWHTEARRAATAAGARVGLVFPPADWAITPVQLQETKRLTEALAQALGAAREIHLTTPAGTDLHFSADNRPGFACYSLLHEPGSTATIPDWGDAELAPVEGTAQGTLVIDGSMTFVGLIETPIVMTVEEGRVTDIQGGVEATRLREILAGADDGATNIAEFGIGTVSRGQLTGHKDDKLLGTAHVALGHNLTLGGTVHSCVHLDGVMRQPTIILDGNQVMTLGTVSQEFSYNDEKEG